MQSSVSTKWSLLRKFHILLSLLIYCVFSLQIINVVNVSNGGSVKREMRTELHSSSTRNESTDVITDCLTCASLNKEIAIHLKVEAIKQQILSKLQLKDRPKLTSAIPRELVDEALKKAHLDVDKHRPRVASIKQHQHQRSSTISPSTPILSSSSSSFAPYADHTQSDAATFDFSEDSDEFEMDNDFDDFSPRQSLSEDYYGKTSEIIAFSEPGSTFNGHTLVEFLPHIDKVHDLEVTKAILWVQLRHRKTLTRKVRHMLRERTLTLYVFRVNRKGNETSLLNCPECLLAKKKIQSVKPGWKHIDLRVPVQEWFSGPRSKLTLLIDCAGCDTLLVDILLFNKEQHRNENGKQHGEQNAPKSSHGHKSGYRPFLVIGTKPIASHRSKRHVITCDTRVKQCCKQSLYISFKELGWSDWIIAPKGYYANYCMGDCSKRGRTPDTFAHFHSHVIDEYRNKNPYASITPCCAPTRLSAMSLIYFDRDLNIIKADLPKMIVDECGCT